ncbi:MAG: polyprenyl synthetase family protein [Pirellulales bacterium]
MPSWAAPPAACDLVGGQADDLAEEGKLPGARCNPSRTPAEGLAALEAIHRRKTGAMILVSLRLGAIVAGAGPAQRSALDEYGRRLGLTFQIMDDLLDVRGSEAAVGKRVGKDAARGKLTFPGLLGEAESLRRAETLTAEAIGTLQGLKQLGLQQHGLGTDVDVLEDLARYVVERNH